MGMYTHVRGWIELESDDDSDDKFKKVMKEAEDLSPRSNQCVSSTVFNYGFDFSPYIFIGGQIKNYDDDWTTFLRFINDNFDISDYRLEMKYEEDDDWKIVHL